MTAFTERNLNQTAVYWATPTPDGSGGHTWAAPVEIDCRWEASTKLIRAANGEEIVCMAEVQVNQDLDQNGMLYLGDLDDLSVAQKADPMTVEGAYHIRRFDKVPAIKGAAFFRKAYL
ncbi:MAG: hypothetical protein V3U75_12940 [Methylococcaceae bacterium]